MDGLRGGVLRALVHRPTLARRRPVRGARREAPDDLLDLRRVSGQLRCGDLQATQIGKAIFSVTWSALKSQYLMVLEEVRRFHNALCVDQKAVGDLVSHPWFFCLC